MNRFQTRIAVIFAALVGAAFAQAPGDRVGKSDPALRAKTDAAMAIRYLDEQQQADGCWTSGGYSGLTALIVQAYLATTGGKEAKAPAVHKGLDFIRKNARQDGSIAGERMANYNTSTCLATLLRAGEPRDSATTQRRGRNRHALISTTPSSPSKRCGSIATRIAGRKSQAHSS